MRLASVAVVAAMLLAVGPSLGEHLADGTYEVNSTSSFQDWIVVEDDAYVKPGWWAGEDTNNDKNGNDHGDGGLAVDLSQGDAEARQEVEWLRITEHDDGNATDTVTVTVDTEGTVVGAIDVFKVRKNGGITPDCPQDLVEDLYPGDQGVLFYAARILHETTDYHQRSVKDGSVSVDLHLDRSSSGFLVAIYPEAASNDGITSSDQANVTYTVSTDGRAEVRNGQDNAQPTRPYDTDEWIFGGDFLDPTVSCAQKGVELPAEATDGDLDELPGPGPATDRIGSLLDADLKGVSR